MNEIVRIQSTKETYDLVVSWTLHSACNYSCSYCPESLHTGKYDWLELEKLKKFIDAVEKFYVQKLNYRKVIFSFAGGEPTIWKGFQPLVEYLGEKGFRIGLTSNGSMPISFWNKVAPHFDFICLTFHPEKNDQKKFIDTYNSLIDNFNCVNPTARIMMHDQADLWDRSYAVYKKIKDESSGYTIQCVRIVDNYDGDATPRNYPEEKSLFLQENAFIEKIQKNPNPELPKYIFSHLVEFSNGEEKYVNENDLINNNLVNFKGWKCNIGLEQIYIDDLGDVYKAGCLVGGKIGHIYQSEEIEFDDKPVICTKNLCHCGVDIRVSKVRPGYHLK